MFTAGRYTMKRLVEGGYGRGNNKARLLDQIDKGNTIDVALPSDDENSKDTKRITARPKLSPKGVRYWELHIPAGFRALFQHIARTERVEAPTRVDLRALQTLKDSIMDRMAEGYRITPQEKAYLTEEDLEKVNQRVAADMGAPDEFHADLPTTVEEEEELELFALA